MNQWTRRILLPTLVLIVAAAARSTAAAAEPVTSAKEVFQRFKDRYHGEDNVMDLRLVLINKRGEERTMKMMRFRRRQEGLVSTSFFFLEPADVRGTGTLTVEQPEGEDLQRIYLPSLKKHRRIATGDKGKSWLGTDLRYEDIQEKKPDDFNYSELGSDTVGVRDCYHFSMMPKTPEKSSYGRIEYWARKDNFEVIQGRYYDKKGICVKVMKMGNLVQTRDSKGQHTIDSQTWMAMYDLKDNHRTIMITDRVAYNIGLDDNFFTTRFIETEPRPFEGGVVHQTNIQDCLFDPETVQKRQGPDQKAANTRTGPDGKVG